MAQPLSIAANTNNNNNSTTSSDEPSTAKANFKQSSVSPGSSFKSSSLSSSNYSSYSADTTISSNSSPTATSTVDVTSDSNGLNKTITNKNSQQQSKQQTIGDGGSSSSSNELESAEDSNHDYDSVDDEKLFVKSEAKSDDDEHEEEDRENRKPTKQTPSGNDDQAVSVENCMAFWKSFDLCKIQNEMSTYIVDIKMRQQNYDDLNKKYIDLNKEMKKSLSEDVLKTVSPNLNNLQTEIDNISKRCRTIERNHVELFELLVTVPNPLPILDLYQKQTNNNNNNSESENGLIKRLESENKRLREELDEANQKYKLHIKRGTKDNEDLIDSLTKEVAKTTSINFELTSQLKISQGEIESYKKILVDYQNKLTEMKVKYEVNFFSFF